MRAAEMIMLDADTIHEIERQQDDSMPKEDLSRFAGEWVALRRGRVVAHDSEYSQLRHKPAVRDGDVAVRVPGPGETELA